MEVIIPQLSGFCPGVKRAVDELMALHNKNPGMDIYVYGQLINNTIFINHLKKFNIITVEDVKAIPKGSVVVIRTHGIDCIIEAELREQYQVVDLTCPSVKRIHQKISQFSLARYFIVITGNTKHPETLAHKSYAEKSHIIDSVDELEKFGNEYRSILDNAGRYSKIYIVSQTTGDAKLFNKTKEKILCFKDIHVEFYDSICNLTARKEEQAASLLPGVDISFVIGDTISSNASKLFKKLSSMSKNVYFINDLDDLLALKIDLSKYKKALVVSSASTPDFTEKTVSNYLQNL